MGAMLLLTMILNDVITRHASPTSNQIKGKEHYPFNHCQAEELFSAVLMLIVNILFYDQSKIREVCGVSVH